MVSIGHTPDSDNLGLQSARSAANSTGEDVGVYFDRAFYGSPSPYHKPMDLGPRSLVREEGSVVIEVNDGCTYTTSLTRIDKRTNL